MGGIAVHLVFCSFSECKDVSEQALYTGARRMQQQRVQDVAELSPQRTAPGAVSQREYVNANMKMSVFAEKECHFSPDSIQVYTALTTTSLVGLKSVKP